MLDYANDLINNSKNSHTKILLPCDVACLKDMKKNKDYYTAPIDNILDDYYALDIGEKTVELFKNTIKKSKLIIWNGPMGVFEINNFKKGTKNIARYIKEISNDKDLLSIIGGGDTANCIIKLGLEDVFTHVSTGGGASLQLLSGKKLQILESWSEDGK